MVDGTESAGGLPPFGLTWGVKRSFIRYIFSVPDVEVSVGDGAGALGNGYFSFRPAGSTLNAGTGYGVLAFEGVAAIRGHFGMMSISLQDPRLELGPDGAVLTVVSGDGTRFALAVLHEGMFERSGADLLWSAGRVLLTAEGAPLFNGQYPEGQEMDPVLVRIGLP